MGTGWASLTCAVGAHVGSPNLAVSRTHLLRSLATWEHSWSLLEVSSGPSFFLSDCSKTRYHKVRDSASCLGFVKHQHLTSSCLFQQHFPNLVRRKGDRRAVVASGSSSPSLRVHFGRPWHPHAGPTRTPTANLPNPPRDLTMNETVHEAIKRQSEARLGHLMCGSSHILTLPESSRSLPPSPSKSVFRDPSVLRSLTTAHLKQIENRPSNAKKSLRRRRR